MYPISITTRSSATFMTSILRRSFTFWMTEKRIIAKRLDTEKLRGFIENMEKRTP
jgi:hypothetical protein